MNKFLRVLSLSLVLGATLTGCAKADDKHAVLSVTTSNGEAYVMDSYNEDHTMLIGESGQDKALRHKLILNLQKGETAEIVFKCEECGDEQKIKVDKPFADVLHCKCPKNSKKEDNKNDREYSAIEINYKNNKKDSEKK